MDPQGGHVSKMLYVKTKELGPLGGRAPGAPPRSANAALGKIRVILFRYVRYIGFSLIVSTETCKEV